MFMYTGDNVKAMERWQRITTLIPSPNEMPYFKGNLETNRESNQKKIKINKSHKIFIAHDHTNLEQ